MKSPESLVCIYWYREEIAERFSYPRHRTSALLLRLRQIHGRAVTLRKPFKHAVRYYTDAKDVAFKVTSLDQLS